MKSKLSTRWYSRHLGEEVQIVRWGHFGVPVLIFPTAGGDAEEIERFKLTDVLSELIDGGRIKLYSCDSVAGRTWLTEGVSPVHGSWVQNRFDAFVCDELLGAIRADCESPDVLPIVGGASIGAFNALATLCRHPESFRSAICMSGTYDLEKNLKGEEVNLDFFYSSPLHFLPSMEEGDQLELLRSRFILLTHGQGLWEEPSESWRVAEVLGSRDIPNRVDAWGPEWNHDWPTWREMLPKYIEELIG